MTTAQKCIYIPPFSYLTTTIGQYYKLSYKNDFTTWLHTWTKENEPFFFFLTFIIKHTIYNYYFTICVYDGSSMAWVTGDKEPLGGGT